MKPIERNEAVAIFISIAVIAIVFAGVRFLPLNAGAVADSGGADIVDISQINDTASVSDALIDATTFSGRVTKLIIEDTAQGSGSEVTLGSVVTVHYVGSLQDGTKFDNSFTRGEPFTFTVGKGEVIEGWDRGIVGMRKGGERILVIPASMAYGNRQVGPIPPNSTLLFAIEVLEVR